MAGTRRGLDGQADRRGPARRAFALVPVVGPLVLLVAVALAAPGSLTVAPAHSLQAPLGGLDLAAVRSGATAATNVAGSPGSPILLSPSVNSSRPQWWDVTSESTTALPVEEFTEGTWDGADDSVLFYGGDDYSSNLNGTWSYEAGQWTEVHTRGNPGAISGGSLAYDPLTGYSVFYGGVTSFSPVAYNNTTYFYSHENWTSANQAVTPPAPLAGDMAFDPALGGLVLFGGIDLNAPSTVLNQTWLFQNGTWSHIATPTAPPGRWLAEMAYDYALNEMVLYGGYDASGNSLSDTWVFANGTWSSVSASGLGVPPTGAGFLVYDPDLGVLVLAGGLDEFGNLQVGTWGFNGAVWSVLAATGTPHGHDAGIGVWDPVDHELVLAGGGGAGQPSYTDVLSIPLRPVNLTTPNETDVGVRTSFSASALGGATPYTFAWNWGDDTSNASATATHIYTTANSYVVTLTVRGPSTNVATWQGEITVVHAPTPKATLPARGIDAGVPAMFAATVTGGVAPDAFDWAFSDGGTASGSSVSHTFAVAGDYVLNLTAVDSAGGNGSILYDLVANASPTVGVVPANAPEAGAQTTFQSYISGGVPPFSYAWRFAGGGTAAVAAPLHRFASAGEQWVNLTLTDSDGVVTWANTSVDVVPAVTVSIVGPSSTSVGSTVTYTANVTNGVGPFTVTWTLPNDAGANGSSTDFYYSGTGVFTVSVSVTDSNGVVATGSLNVSVTSTSTSLFGGSIGGVPTWALVVALVVIGVVAIAALALGRRRTPPAAPDEPPAPEAAPTEGADPAGGSPPAG